MVTIRVTFGIHPPVNKNPGISLAYHKFMRVLTRTVIYRLNCRLQLKLALVKFSVLLMK